MKPLGLVHFNHKLVDGQVAWHQLGTAERNPNYGDMLVCASLLRQTRADDTVRFMFGGEAPEPLDRALIRGSTYLSRRFDYDKAIATLDSIDAPVAMVGLGAQAASEDPGFLDDIPAARRFIEKLSEKSASISVRGDFTAAVVERLGGTNIRVTGCPSMFYSLSSPTVSVPETLPLRKQRRLGLSIHTGLMKGLFCRNPAAARRKHGRAVQFALRNSASVSIFEQGVPLEYAVGNRALPLAERVAAAQEILDRFPNATAVEPIDLVSRMVSVRTIEEWLSKARDMDAMIGFRFHGNMVALTQGVPCFYFVYDTRLAEFCRLYRLPFLDVEEDWVNPVQAILAHDWGDTTTAIRGCFEELCAFYDENGITHRLGA